ncbi:MAG TPA: polyprenyl synthetase family protein [Candidatus Methylomirabilis sp.]|nr:polyprenyl synthetase family protein [Candidatus Methylomirabilis sp.]
MSWSVEPKVLAPAVKAPTPLETLLKDRVALAVGAELKAVEEAIAAQIESPVALIHEMGEFIAGAGGKRLRPILLLMAARLAGYVGPRAVRMGCVVELLHTATLIHDDVVDRAPLRRGRPSANARWGDDASVLVGDHLYSKSFALMVQDGDAEVLETLARATVSMTEAEVFQLEKKRSGVMGEADYLRIITQKTASFMSACCRIGALLGHSDPGQVEGLTRYGLDIGIAFQISDDSLDFIADQERLGKAIGADLKEGKRTLPLISTLGRAAPHDRERIQTLLKGSALDPHEIEEIRQLVVKYEGIEYALERAHQYAQSAKQALRPFTDCEDKETLALIADFVVDRDC